jgi:hypothetical protein
LPILLICGGKKRKMLNIKKKLILAAGLVTGTIGISLAIAPAVTSVLLSPTMVSESATLALSKN